MLPPAMPSVPWTEARGYLRPALGDLEQCLSQTNGPDRRPVPLLAGREVDFVVMERAQPLDFIESKLSAPWRLHSACFEDDGL